MTLNRRAVVGLTLLCALLFCAFAAQSASAVSGRTAFTCVKTEGGAGFKDSHCTGAVASGAAFKHVEIEQGLLTKTHITNEKTDAATLGSTNTVLKATFLGVENEVVCSKVLGHSEVSNTQDGITKEHIIHVTKTTLHHTGCKVNKPAGCVIPNETLLIKGITGTTQGQGGAASIVFSPEEGEALVTITYEKCTNPFLNGAHVLSGSTTAKLNGATTEFSHNEITTSKKLTYGGAAAGVEGKLTISQASLTTKEGDAPATTGNPISTTQVNT